jgi:hypothetical protein
MATKFIVRSEGGTKALSLKTVVYDGLKIGRLVENGVSIFEIPSDQDVIIELVVKCKSSSAAAVSSISAAMTGSKASPTSEPSKKREAPAFTPDDILMKRYSAEEIAVRDSLNV